MYCNKCGRPIPDGSTFCNACGTPQQSPPPPQQKAALKMPTSYYVDSWILFGLCLAYGIIRGLIGLLNGSERDIYKGIIACCASLIFIPGIKVVNNATATLLIKLAVAVGAVILI